ATLGTNDANALVFETNGTEAIRIDTDGDVGINVTNPTEKLHVDGKLRFVSPSETAFLGNAKLFVGDQPETSARGSLSAPSLTNISTYGNGAGAVEGIIMQWGGSTDAAGFKLSDDGVMIWGSGDENLFAVLDEDANAFRLVVDDTGDVGLGTATPSAALHLSRIGDAQLLIEADTDDVDENDNPSIRLTQDGGAIALELGIDSSNSIYFGSATSQMTIAQNGSVAFGDGLAGGALLGNNNVVQLTSDTEGEQIGYELFSSEGTNNRRVSFYLNDADGTYGFKSTYGTGPLNFVIRDAGGIQYLGINQTSGNITVGASDTTGALLVLDTKTTAGDPAGTNGGMYYNSNANKFRCYENGTWTDCITAAGGGTLQAAYNNSTSPEIVLDGTRGALTLRDNATPIGANLLEVQDNGGTTTYLAVTASGTSVTGTVSATGSLNSSDGGVQTNGTTRVDNGGNLVNIGNLTASGAITIASTGAGNDVVVDGTDEFIVQDNVIFNGTAAFNNTAAFADSVSFTHD
ncbi:MAG: hypothetical protein ACREQV_14060, partial [Candidatus Binatia bacterium]